MIIIEWSHITTARLYKVSTKSWPTMCRKNSGLANKIWCEFLSNHSVWHWSWQLSAHCYSLYIVDSGRGRYVCVIYETCMIKGRRLMRLRETTQTADSNYIIFVWCNVLGRWTTYTYRPLGARVSYVPFKWVAHTTLWLLGSICYYVTLRDNFSVMPFKLWKYVDCIHRQ